MTSILLTANTTIKEKNQNSRGTLICLITKKSDQDIKGQEHGKNFNDRLPPTLKVRETIVFDINKEVPAEVKAFDLKKKREKQRYELRYKLEDQYRDRDIEQQEKDKERAVGKYHGEKFYEEAIKGYDNITLEKTDLEKYRSTSVNKPNYGCWEKVQISKNQELDDPFFENSVKTGYVKTRFPEYVHNALDQNQQQTGGLAIHSDEAYQQMQNEKVTVKSANSPKTSLFSGGEASLKFEPYHKNVNFMPSASENKENYNNYCNDVVSQKSSQQTTSQRGNGNRGNQGFDNNLRQENMPAYYNQTEAVNNQPKYEAFHPDMLNTNQDVQHNNNFIGNTQDANGLRRRNTESDKQSFYSNSSKGGGGMQFGRNNYIGSGTLDRPKNEDYDKSDIHDQISQGGKSKQSKTSYSGKFPSIRNKDMMGGSDAYNPPVNDAKQKMMYRSRSSVKSFSQNSNSDNKSRCKNITSGGFN